MLFLNPSLTGSGKGCRPVVQIPDHVEVIMIDIDDFDFFGFFERVRNRPADTDPFVEVHDAFVASMVQLDGTDQRHNARRIDKVGDLFLDDADVVALDFLGERDATANRASLFERPHDFVIAWRVECLGRSARGDGAEDRSAIIALVHVVFPFWLVLVERTQWNWNGQGAEVGPLRCHPEAAGVSQCPDRQDGEPG